MCVLRVFLFRIKSFTYRPHTHTFYAADRGEREIHTNVRAINYAANLGRKKSEKPKHKVIWFMDPTVHASSPPSLAGWRRQILFADQNKIIIWPKI